MSSGASFRELETCVRSTDYRKVGDGTQRIPAGFKVQVMRVHWVQRTAAGERIPSVTDITENNVKDSLVALRSAVGGIRLEVHIEKIR